MVRKKLWVTLIFVYCLMLSDNSNWGAVNTFGENQEDLQFDYYGN